MGEISNENIAFIGEPGEGDREASYVSRVQPDGPLGLLAKPILDVK
jgi:hypothetical protein